MIYRPDLAHRPEGELIDINGQTHRHVGGGQFAPAQSNDLLKRFDVNEGENLHRVAA